MLDMLYQPVLKDKLATSQFPSASPVLLCSYVVTYGWQAELKEKQHNVTYQQQSMWKAEPSETGINIFQSIMEILVVTSGTTYNP